MHNKKHHKIERRIKEYISKLLSDEAGLFGRFVPYYAYGTQIAISLELLLILENSEIYLSKLLEERELLQSQARKNFLINSVTALENFLIYWIINLFDWEFEVLEKTNGEKYFLNWEGIKEVIEAKGNLGLLVEEIKEGEITRWKNPAHIIISTFSFQNLNDINFVMTKITERNFFKEVENMESEFVDFVSGPGSEAIKKLIDNYTKEIAKINLEKNDYIEQGDWKSQLIDLKKKLLEKQGKFILKKEFPNWKEKLGYLFELRNEFVHFVKSRKLSPGEVSEFLVALDYFVQAVEHFLFNEIRDPILLELLYLDLKEKEEKNQT